MDAEPILDVAQLAHVELADARPRGLDQLLFRSSRHARSRADRGLGLPARLRGALSPHAEADRRAGAGARAHRLARAQPAGARAPGQGDRGAGARAGLDRRGPGARAGVPLRDARGASDGDPLGRRLRRAAERARDLAAQPGAAASGARRAGAAHRPLQPDGRRYASRPGFPGVGARVPGARAGSGRRGGDCELPQRDEPVARRGAGAGAVAGARALPPPLLLYQLGAASFRPLGTRARGRGDDRAWPGAAWRGERHLPLPLRAGREPHRGDRRPGLHDLRPELGNRGLACRGARCRGSMGWRVAARTHSGATARPSGRRRAPPLPEGRPRPAV